MALRIGAFLLASYNLVSAHVIDYHGSLYSKKAYIAHKGDRPEPTPSLGVGIKNYAIDAKNCNGGPSCKVVKKIVVREDDCHGEVLCVKKRYGHYHGDAHSHGVEHAHADVHSHDDGHSHGYKYVVKGDKPEADGPIHRYGPIGATR